MARVRKILAIDIGSSKVVAMETWIRDSEEIETPHLGVVETDAFLAGELRDMEEGIHALDQAIRKALGGKRYDKRPVFVGVSNPRFSWRIVDGHVSVSGRRIEKNDLERAMVDACQISLPEDEVVLYAHPNRFHVDNSRDVKNPIGMPGKRLEVDALLTLAKRTDLEKLNAVFDALNIKNVTYCYHPLATSFAVLDEEDFEEGAILLDFGKMKTNVAVWYRNGVLFLGTMIGGGEHITHDLQNELRIPRQMAESVKMEIGDVFEPENPDEVISLSIGGQDLVRRFRRAEAIEIIRARVEDIFRDRLVPYIEHHRVFQRVHTRVILVGGAAKMPGIPALIQHYLDLPVYLGTVRGFQKKSPVYKDLSLAAVAGVARMAQAILGFGLQSSRLPVRSRGLRSGFRRFVEFLKENF